jgi:hypothetical protein
MLLCVDHIMLSLAFSESVSLFRLECGDTVGFASLILPQVCNVCNGIFMRPQVTIVVSMHSGYRLVSAVGNFTLLLWETNVYGSTVSSVPLISCSGLLCLSPVLLALSTHSFLILFEFCGMSLHVHIQFSLLGLPFCLTMAHKKLLREDIHNIHFKKLWRLHWSEKEIWNWMSLICSKNPNLMIWWERLCFSLCIVNESIVLRDKIMK